jgi:hypothetical protein
MAIIGDVRATVPDARQNAMRDTVFQATLPAARQIRAAQALS